MKMDFVKRREAFINKTPIQNNLFHFSHRCHDLGETKLVFTGNVSCFPKDYFSHQIQIIVSYKWNLILQNWERFVLLTSLYSKCSFLFYTVLTGWENLKDLHKLFFSKIYNFTIWVISFKGIFRGVWDDFGEKKTWVFSSTWLLTKTYPRFPKIVTIRDMQEKLCCNCFYFQNSIRFRIQG